MSESKNTGAGNTASPAPAGGSTSINTQVKDSSANSAVSASKVGEQDAQANEASSIGQSGNVGTHNQGQAGANSYNQYSSGTQHGKSYNNKQYGGSRHNSYSNANSGSNGGGVSGASRQNYNNRKNSYASQKQGGSNQYNSYGQYPSNMYYGYYGNPYGYTMVPSMPPVQAYQQAQASLSSQSNRTGSSSFSSGKITITDKFGNPIDLEEKKKHSSSSTPTSSPAKNIASLNTASKSSTESSSATSAPATAAKAESSSANTPSAVPSATPKVDTSKTSSTSASSTQKLSIAEEFKRKILERAAKAAQKEEPKTESETEVKDEAKAEIKEESNEESKEKPKEEPKEESKEESKEELKEEPKEELKENPKTETETEVKEEPKEEPKEESKEEPRTKSETEVKVESKDETKKESKEEPKEDSKTEPKEESLEEPKEETKDLDTEAKEKQNEELKPVEEESKLEKDKVESEENVEQKPIEESSEAKADIEQKINKGESENKESAEPEQPEEEGMTLSDFFKRCSDATSIENPYEITYEEPLQGPDTKWKLESSNFRYDPVFLMQFQEPCQVVIDSEWKVKLEELGITGNKRAPSQSGRGGMGKYGSSGNLSRYGNGPIRGGQFNEGRQNSRNGSKRRGGSSGARDKSSRKGNQSRRGGRDKNEEEKPSKPKEDVKPLEKSENRWVPRSRVKTTEVKTAPDGSIILEAEDVARKVNSLLNKLTLEMFEPITDDILKLAEQSKWEDDAKTVRQIISLTFAKACDEPYWSSMYAQFCAKMCKEISTDIKDVNMIDRNGEVSKGGDLARRILLSTCQEEYEKGWTDKLPTNEDGTPLEPEMMSDEYYIMAAAKRRGLGLVKFIGHLYILNMLNDQVILICLKDQSSNTEDPSEDRLESLSQLIKTVGARLETKEKTKAALNYVFDNIETILENVKLSSRIKFMLMDLIDLRKDHWSNGKTETGPKTIQEIHDEAELKRYEDEKAAAEKRRKNKSGDSRSNSSRGSGFSSWGSSNKGLMKDLRAPPQKDDRGFTAVSRSQSNRPNITSEPSSTNIGARDNSKRSESIQSAVNMFAALGDEEEHEVVQAEEEDEVQQQEEDSKFDHVGNEASEVKEE